MTVTKSAKRAPEIMEFIHSHKKWLMTTRFNSTTWNENLTFRSKYTKIGCIYPSPEPISSMVPTNDILFVLEMNNDENRIMGIGMLANKARCDNKYRVYTEQNYNRYTYLGTNRIDRSNMTEEEETIMKVFDILCFKGPKHMKRLRGIKVFPPDMLYRCKQEVDLVDFVKNMFKRRIKERTEENT